jgi:hypothetical protein
MAVDFKTFLQVIPHVTSVKKPVLIRGRHGVGKSEVVYQFAQDFINQNRAHLEHRDEYEPNKVYPSRRSWDRFNECVTGGVNLLAAGASPVIFNLAGAFLGFEAAVAFNDFVQNYDRQVTIADILVDGKMDMVAEWGINDHTAFVEKLEASKTFKDALSDDQVQNLATYFFTLPSEVAMKLWTVLGSSENDINNTIRLHQAQVDGVPVSQRMVDMLQADDGKKE